MKILFLARSFSPKIGGLEKVAELWASYLQEKGYQVTVATNRPGSGSTNFSFTLVREPGMLKLRRLINRSDVVVSFDISLKQFPLILFSGKPWIVSHHTALFDGVEPSRWEQRLKHLVCNRFPDSNIACSSALSNQFKNCLTAHSPYNQSIFYDEGLKRIPHSLLFVGRLVSVKGVRTLIEAVEKLDGRYSLSIVGDGPERASLEELVHTKSLKNRIEFLGSKSDKSVAQLMNSHETLVVPSLVEPFGTVVLEGLACGCKVITSNAGGLPEAGGGFTEIFMVGDVDALAQKLELEAITVNSTNLHDFLQSHTVAHSATRLLAEIMRIAK